MLFKEDSATQVKLFPKVQAAYVGSPVVIICESNFSVQWLVHSVLLTSSKVEGNKYYMFITDARENDGGEYACIVDNQDERDEDFMDISILHVGGGFSILVGYVCVGSISPMRL